MSEPEVRELVRVLKSPELRTRTGIVELPAALLVGAREWAIRWNVGLLDMQLWEMQRIPEGRTRFRLGAPDLSKHLSVATSELAPSHRAVLAANVDLLVARMKQEDRQNFWRHVRNTFRPMCGLLVLMPSGALHLLAEAERRLWIESDRLCTWEGSEDASALDW